MKKLSSNEIRTMWLDFFKSKGHLVIPSANLIPVNDKSLLWINAGVAALKQYFDGTRVPENKRLTNIQKCIRTNDFENVGKTSRHHTFFEMLGNFSIGDYFRKEAIDYAFEILTSPKYFDMPLDKLYFTYHPSDHDTFNFWRAHGVKEDHLIPLESNFWEIGEGPCGPNTEVFFDRGEKYDKDGKGVTLLQDEIENDRYLEIWGIVFSQFNAEPGVPRSEYKELPSKNIDTGAGLERIAAVLQETETNFETDLFMPLINKISELTNKKYTDDKVAFRVIADHIRATTFALSDGALFSNEGRGYVLRRLVRRAMRYGRKLGLNRPFLGELVDVVVEIYEDFYPYLHNEFTRVKKLILSEEKRFLLTLQNGENILRKVIETDKVITSETAFKLYDTYGFPLDITKEIAEEEGVKVDLSNFENLLNEQRERARKARGVENSMQSQSADLLAFTEPSEFSYDDNELTSVVIGTFVNGAKVDKIDDEGEIIVKKTPFYAESGGQVSDEGTLENDSTFAEIVSLSKAPHGQHLHHIKVHYGEVKVGDEVTLKIKDTKRQLTMRNHSATHLLQSALHLVLGDNITQQGSFVNDEYLRFDFNYDGKPSEKELNEIELKVNEFIARALPRKTEILPLEEAKKRGATALFSEKYGNIVRMVGFGNVSLELCGGTHVNNTADIGVFVILSEHSVAAGIRRIVATTSLNAYKEIKNREENNSRLLAALNAKNTNEALTAINQLQVENARLTKQIAGILQERVNEKSKELASKLEKVNDVYLLVMHLEGANRKFLSNVIDNLKVSDEARVIILSGEENGSYPLVVALSKSAIEKDLKAGVIMKKVATYLGGSGGGQPAFAQGSFKSKDKLGTLKDYVKKEVLNG